MARDLALSCSLAYSAAIKFIKEFLFSVGMKSMARRIWLKASPGRPKRAQLIPCRMNISGFLM